MKITSIQSSFVSRGWHFDLLHRQGRVALFRKSRGGLAFKTYEVVRLRVYPAETIKGAEYPEREALPPSEAWGAEGWTCSSLEEAHRRFDRLINPVLYPSGTRSEASRPASGQTASRPRRRRLLAFPAA